MNPFKIIALLASASVAFARIIGNERNLIKDGHPDAGTCDFNEDLKVYAGMDWCAGYGIAEVCVGVDGESHPKTGSMFPENFVDLAAWDCNNKADTIQCYHARGYSVADYYRNNEHFMEFIGHVLVGWSQLDISHDEKIETPGLYWLQGGKLVSRQENCLYDPDTATYYDCDPAFIDQALGTWVNVCEEIANA